MIITLFAKLFANLRIFAEAMAEGIEMNRRYARQHPGADS